MKCTVLFALFALVAVVAAQVPPEWTCQEALYDSNDACDCDCGAYDPDCDVLSFVRGCDEIENQIYYCDDVGECIYVERVVPSSWRCEDIQYDNGDGVCNCGCGAYDPDCDNPTAVADCHFGLNPSCTSEGTCEYESELPEGWICSGYAYDSLDGCDCACGIPDPDCEVQPDIVFNCPCEEMTCSQGYCAGFCDGRVLFVTDATEARDVQFQETTPIEEVFRIDHASEKMPQATVAENNDELPFFDKRHIDRSVSEGTMKRYIHSSTPDAHVKNMLVQWGVFDPQQTDVLSIGRRKQVTERAARATPPPEWTCNELYYDAADGCDCDCGAPDPDCDLPGQYTFGCPVTDLPEGTRPACTAQGACTFTTIEIPEDWRCDPDYYAFADGCDCQCGAYDPDCDFEGSIVFNCNEGYEPTCTAESACTYGVPIPEGWFCPFYYYEDGDCDCNCGAQDSDCDLPHENLYGCGQCRDPATMSCDEGFCVGECNGVFLGFEVLEYWNPLLQPGAPDIEDLYNLYTDTSFTNVVNYSPFSFSARSPLSPRPDDDDSSIESPVSGGRVSFRADGGSSSSASTVAASVALLALAGLAAL